MEPSRKHKSSGVPVKEEVELEDGNVKVGKKNLFHPFFPSSFQIHCHMLEFTFSLCRLNLCLYSDGVSCPQAQYFKKKLVKRRKTEVSGSIVQLQQQIEVFHMENKAPDGHPVEDSNGKDTMDVLTSCAVQNSGHGNESAILRLLKICKAAGWREPSYDFEEQGPPHMKIFKCKVTVHLDGLVNTILECFSDPKPYEKAAQEHAAEGALWFLQRSGYVK